MNNFEDQNLPPELGDVAKQLRDNRHEASPLELDQAKQRIIRRASATSSRTRRFGWLRKPTFVTAAIVALSIGGGSAAAFGVHFEPHAAVRTAAKPSAAAPAFSIPGLGGGIPGLGGGGVSASQTQYGNPFQTFLQEILDAIGSIFGGGGGGAGGLVSGILAALSQLLAALGL
jgi:hypothetical protein